MSDFLATMAQRSRDRARRLRWPTFALPPLDPPAFSGFTLITEVKRSSPSRAFPATDVVDRARRYVAAGASAISVLTEPTAFGGSLDDLRAVAAAVDVPVMRKDFLVDPLQVVEAALAGARGVLLVHRLLSEPQLDEMLAAARELGLFVLLETFAPEELERAAVHDVLLGVNCRDLRTLRVDPTRFAAPLPPGRRVIAESGLFHPADVLDIARFGYRGALVGSALMERADPGPLVAEMVRAGRTACASA